MIVPEDRRRITISVPADIAYRHLVIRAVTTACAMAAGQSGVDDDDFGAEVVSAAGEAFNNIALHGHAGRAPEGVAIDIDWDDRRIAITFTDRGHAFDPRTAAPLIANEKLSWPDLDDLPEHGMGIFIILRCMDEVEYEPGPPNVLRLVKLRAPRHRRAQSSSRERGD